MKFSEAMKHYEQGKSIRVKDWPPGSKMTPGEDDGVHLNVGTFLMEWELCKEPKVSLSKIQDGELFEYGGTKYRKMPKYALEYAVHVPEYTIAAIGHCYGEQRGKVFCFTPDCLVRKVD